MCGDDAAVRAGDHLQIAVLPGGGVHGDPGGNDHRRLQRPVVEVLVPGNRLAAAVLDEEVGAPQQQVGPVQAGHPLHDGRIGGQVVHGAAVQVAIVRAVAVRRNGVQNLLDGRPQRRHLCRGAQRKGPQVSVTTKPSHFGSRERRCESRCGTRCHSHSSILSGRRNCRPAGAASVRCCSALSPAARVLSRCRTALLLSLDPGRSLRCQTGADVRFEPFHHRGGVGCGCAAIGDQVVAGNGADSSDARNSSTSATCSGRAGLPSG